MKNTKQLKIKVSLLKFLFGESSYVLGTHFPEKNALCIITLVVLKEHYKKSLQNKNTLGTG